MSLTSYQAAPPRVLECYYARRSCESKRQIIAAPRQNSGRHGQLVGPGFCRAVVSKGECGQTERLGWYAQHFEMVEVNSTFYSVPDLRMVERWCGARRRILSSM